jgi:uncharacterized membrane protein/protein-disulfide isomerase
MWVMLLALGGLVAAGTSTYVHFRLVMDPGYSSFCDINSSISCTQVYESSYGSVGGVPVALGGVVWFVGVLLLAMADAKGPRKSRQNVGGYLIVWSTVGLAVAMYMAYASFLVLQTFCVLCGAVYLAVIGIFLLSETGSATAFRRLPAAFVQDLGRLARRPVGLSMTVVFLVGGVASAVPAATTDQRTEFDRWWADQPRIELPVTTEEAAVVVVKFNDYQCPACGRTFLLYEGIFAKYASSHPGAVRLVTMDYPLDPKCNDQSQNGPHDSACEAAVAVRLARQVGEAEAERMQRWLYANQEGMTPAAIKAAASDIAGIEDFDARYAETVQAVKADIAVGATIPVEATPTFVINGVLLKGGLSPEFFDRAIAHELER